jgi:hypothetical protein
MSKCKNDQDLDVPKKSSEGDFHEISYLKPVASGRATVFFTKVLGWVEQHRMAAIGVWVVCAMVTIAVLLWIVRTIVTHPAVRGGWTYSTTWP